MPVRVMIKADNAWRDAWSNGLTLTRDSYISPPVTEEYIVDVPYRVGVLDLSPAQPVYKYREIRLVFKMPCTAENRWEEQARFTQLWHGKHVKVGQGASETGWHFEGKASLSFEWASNVLTVNFMIPYAFPFRLQQVIVSETQTSTTTKTSTYNVPTGYAGTNGVRVTATMTSGTGSATITLSDGTVFGLDMSHKSVSFYPETGKSITVTYIGSVKLAYERMSL